MFLFFSSPKHFFPVYIVFYIETMWKKETIVHSLINIPSLYPVFRDQIVSNE